MRAEIARALGIDPTTIRYINKYNGCTFGATRQRRKYSRLSLISQKWPAGRLR